MIIAIMFGLVVPSGKVEAGNDQHIGEYKIVLNYNGGGSTVTKWIKAGVKYALPSATRSYYSFNGWKNGNKTYNAGYTFYVSQNMTFTASWTCTCSHPGTSVSTKVIKAATCTESGTSARVCNRCGTELSRFTVSILGHFHRITDNGSSVTVKCIRCSSKVYPKTLREFAKYYEGNGRELSTYSADVQNQIKAYWLRYISPTSGLTQDAALKIAKHSSSVNLFFNADSGNSQAIADYLYAINKLSKASYKKTEGLIFKKTTTVYPFSCLTQTAGSIVGNGFSGFIALDRDITNSRDYKLFKLVMDALSKLGGGPSASYFTSVIGEYATITNALLSLAYKGAGQVSSTYIHANYDNRSLKDIADHLDAYYNDCVNPYTYKTMKFGDGYSSNEIDHNTFIQYILNRAHDEYEQLFKVDIDSQTGY